MKEDLIKVSNMAFEVEYLKAIIMGLLGALSHDAKTRDIIKAMEEFGFTVCITREK